MLSDGKALHISINELSGTEYPFLFTAHFLIFFHTVQLMNEETVPRRISYPQRSFDLVILHNLRGTVSFEHHLETNPWHTRWSRARRTKMEVKNRRGWGERPGSVEVNRTSWPVITMIPTLRPGVNSVQFNLDSAQVHDTVKVFLISIWTLHVPRTWPLIPGCHYETGREEGRKKKKRNTTGFTPNWSITRFWEFILKYQILVIISETYIMYKQNKQKNTFPS